MSKYRVILTDPPWEQSRGGKKAVRPNSSGLEIPYVTLGLQGIKDYQEKVMEFAEPDHILFMWTIEKYLWDAEDMAKSLGYKLHSRMIWDKVTGIPAAFTIRFGHEYLLYMWRGKFIPVAESERGKIHSVFREQVTEHSKKPEVSYEIIDRLYPAERKLEMYARVHTPLFPKRRGWDTWGNEVESDIKLDQKAKADEESK